MTRERRTIPLMGDLSAGATDCPLAPPGHASVQSRTLHRACLIVGGADVLAKQLEVSTAHVEGWLRGEEPVPERVFLHAVEIVLLHASNTGRQNWMPASVYSRALRKAGELMGSYQKLSRHLQVPSDELQRWIDGKAVPPVAIFLRVVDYILDETPPPAESAAGDPPEPRDGAPSGDAPATRY